MIENVWERNKFSFFCTIGSRNLIFESSYQSVNRRKPALSSLAGRDEPVVPKLVLPQSQNSKKPDGAVKVALISGKDDDDGPPGIFS